MTSGPVKSSVSVRDLIPGSRLAALRGDLDASDPAVCEGDDVYEVDATSFAGGGRRRGLLFAAAKPQVSWMSPDTELEFLRCIAASDASFVENFIVRAEKNCWYGEKSMLLTLDMGKTISNRQMKLMLLNSESQKTLNCRNTPKPLKKTDYTLAKWPYISQNKLLITNGDDSELYTIAPWMKQSRNKHENAHLYSNEMPVAFETPVDRRAGQHRQPQPMQQQGGVFFPVLHGQMLVYRCPVPMIPYQPSFACRPWPMGGSFFQRLPTTPFPPPSPTFFYWSPRVNTEPMPSVVKAQQYSDQVKYSPKYNRQAQIDIDEFVHDKYIIDKVISTFETKDENALRSFMFLLKRVYPKKLEEFNKMMTIMDYLNSVSV